MLYEVITSSVCSVFALDNYPELITDRPDQTESSVVVPHKSLQIETGFVQENKETSIVNEKAFGYNSTLLRYGLLANFELRLGLEYLAYEIESKHTTFSERASGISPLYTGVITSYSIHYTKLYEGMRVETRSKNADVLADTYVT